MKNDKVIQNPTVEELRKSGNKIRVYHGRKFNGDGTTMVMSRRDWGKRLEESPDFAALKLDNHGGFTLVEITTTDGKQLRGKYNVPKGAQFDRKDCLNRAIGRAFRTIK